MLFVRLGIAIVVTFLSFFLVGVGPQIGSAPSVLPFILVSLALYMFPTIEAFIRGRENIVQIALLNLFLGWTLIGWVAALIWSAQVPRDVAIHTERRDEYRTSQDTKTCPYCAETVKAAALKCKHCGSSLTSS